MNLSKVLNIIASLPQKHQRAIFSQCTFNEKTPAEVFHDVICMAISLCRNAANREILTIYKDMPISDDVIIATFGNMQTTQVEATLSDQQVEWLNANVYRNMAGKFRLLPKDDSSLESIPLDGLESDEEIIAAQLTMKQIDVHGVVKLIDGWRVLRQQPYYPPYENTYANLPAVLSRINIISSFSNDTPSGFFRRDNKTYRNIACQMLTPDSKYVNKKSLNRAMLLMYLVSGANITAWQQLYTIVHAMVHCPNSAVGHIIYLNDFDAGGNGKSKFVSILQHMFADAFTAFEPHQLRFNMTLMGKRLVHISEFEDNEASKPLMGMLKAMTGRDKFQYEGKGLNPIVADTFQNFIISSNRYIYFEDAAVKRRLQNFHCSNFLHLLLLKYYKSPAYLNNLFGNALYDESRIIVNEMAHSLLDFILKDTNQYDVNIKPQNFVLGNLKNPLLRYLFSDRCQFDSFIRETDKGSALDLYRIISEAKPEQYNYAAGVLARWIPQLTPNRDNTTLTCDLSDVALIKLLKATIEQLDSDSIHLRNKQQVYLEYGQLQSFDAEALLDEFFNWNDLQYTTTNTGVTIV